MFNDLKVNQYDALDFDVQLTKDDGTTYVLDEGESIWFTCKKILGGDALLSATQTDLHFRFDRIELSVGEYLAEIGLNFADDTTRTLAHSKLFVCPRLRGDSE